ncbi:hypothetical protein CCR75_003128 [Bremia lactucae]|uniref:Uncharacterized protein n=1 Tax=Bremia lactucae TaxID=4779 RepID=A0A976ICQ0_BRELC|nr:hypothetical protein CCR75_003128 [Bremia lactucae]
MALCEISPLYKIDMRRKFRETNSSSTGFVKKWAKVCITLYTTQFWYGQGDGRHQHPHDKI